MNTDASNVEDMNILQIIERLSMSCIAFSEEWSNIFRNRSFTLFKNDRHLREKFASAAVSESISSSMTNLLYTGLSILVFEISPDFHTWEDHLSSMYHSEWFDELAPNTGLTVLVCCTLNELRSTFWLSDLVFLGLPDAVEANTFGSLTRYRETKFIIGFDFGVTLSSPASSCVLFDIALGLSMELKWLMLNKHKRWFHSSRVKLPLVKMSASWFLVSMYLIWILGSKLILSNNQSRATLWVLETCLIVRLLPFMIILITALLSSKMCNKASLREEFTFEEIKSTLFRSPIFPWIFFRVGDLHGTPRTWLFWHVFPWRTATIRSHESCAGIPSILEPASKEMISDSVELCETEVCFLHIQLIGTNVWLPKMHNVPPDVDFESSRSPAKLESWNCPNLHGFAVFPAWQYCLYSHVRWM